MDAYGSLACHYDALTADVPYDRWIGFYRQLFDRYGIDPALVLDLACGTGNVSWRLSQAGYEVIGVDGSADMLACAAGKSCPSGRTPPIFIAQSMETLDLYGTVDAAVSALDSVNYLVDEDALQRAFDRVRLFLAPGGVFIFDVKSPAGMREMARMPVIKEARGVYCVYETTYNEKDGLARHGITLFQREGGLWRRLEEAHRQRVYPLEALFMMLEKAGFCDAHAFSPFCETPPKAVDERIFIAARKPKEEEEKP